VFRVEDPGESSTYLLRPEKVGALIHREVLLSREDGLEPLG
jgi:hypothetical protein